MARLTIPPATEEPPERSVEPASSCTAYPGAAGLAREFGSQFLLPAGSTYRRQGAPARTSYKGLRDRLVTEGKIVDGPTPELLVVAEDLPLGSPSAGAAILAGRNMNGRIVWKTAAGETCQKWVDSRTPTVAAAEAVEA